jgi:hypothetical protein
MKTTNFSMDLIIPSQLNKDITFNEALLKIDSFMSLSVTNFIDQKPEQLKNGEKFIISTGEHKNKICYKPIESKTILLHEPKAGMIVFVIESSFFLIFANDEWKEIALSGTKLDELVNQDKFISISQKFLLSAKQSLHCLYLDSDTEITIEKKMLPEISIIIKQSFNNSFNIHWPPNILWENKQPHTMSKSQNSMDLIKLYQLPESQHFLGKIIAQNFNY